MAFALETYALTKVDDVKALIDIAAATTTWDQVFIELINSATLWLENECGGRRFGNTAVPVYTNETYDSNDMPEDEGTQKWLFLKAFPVTTFTTVEYRTGTSTYAVLDAGAYETYADRGGIYFYGGVPRGKKSVRLTYTAGYLISWATQATHTLPHDLTHACRKLVLKEFSKRKAQGLTAESVGGASIAWNEDVDPEITAIVAKYKRAYV